MCMFMLKHASSVLQVSIIVASPLVRLVPTLYRVAHNVIIRLTVLLVSRGFTWSIIPVYHATSRCKAALPV